MMILRRLVSIPLFGFAGILVDIAEVLLAAGNRIGPPRPRAWRDIDDVFQQDIDAARTRYLTRAASLRSRFTVQYPEAGD